MNTHLQQPGEWEPHAAVWTAWPSDASLWLENLSGARREVAALCQLIADLDPNLNQARGEAVHVLACGDEAVASAREALAASHAVVHEARFGDIWLRDTAPIFVRETASPRIVAVGFDFNGWGGKYVLDFDDTVARQVARLAGTDLWAHNWVLEGGSIDADGLGTALTTSQCLLHPNRNPSLSKEEIAANLRSHLGIEHIIWLGDGLINDHTDGHIDNIARFVAPGKVVCMHPSGKDDPNAAIYRKISSQLRTERDADGRPLEVIEIPSPGKVLDDEGKIIPASHMNFYIANTTVAVPVYGTPYDQQAVEALQLVFPDRKVVGLPANNILTGGGSFHCITQQQPFAT
ncbi:MAG: agmatine deiminase family protein [Verrucomicrobia bacterium]|nr:agmatine deiminase family protein [Verrucomicrobiota bacterium]